MIRPLVHIHQKKKIAPEIAAEIASVTEGVFQYPKSIFYSISGAFYPIVYNADMAFKDPKSIFQTITAFYPIG
jgi:hypothetical protein